MRILGLVFAIAVAACGGKSDSTLPTEPAGVPPLPPASGSPIGILVDEASSLNLNDTQLEKLRAIDQSLAYENEQLDAEERPAMPSGGGGGGGMGGPPGGGFGGGGGGGRHGGGRGHRGGGGNRGGGAPDTPASAGLHDKPHHVGGGDPRSDNTRDAFTRAFALFDPKQAAAARTLLEQHDVDMSLVPDVTAE